MRYSIIIFVFIKNVVFLLFLWKKSERWVMNSAISMRMIETASKQIKSKHVLMAFDSCFSGAIFQMVLAKPSPYIQEKVV